jgi:hypothetical protein
MRPLQSLVGIALLATAVASCSRPKGYDEMNLIVEEVGHTTLDTIAKPPTHDGEITTWRTTFPGQVFAAVKTRAACPRDIHSVAGALVKKDRIELCFTATPRAEPVPGFPCSEEVYLKYEIMRVPADVEPKFVYVGACAPQPLQP